MISSWFPRNILVISGVAISHLLIFLGLLSASHDDEELKNKEFLILSLRGDGAKQSSLKKPISTPQLSSSPTKDSLSFIKGESDFPLAGEKGINRQVDGNARQTLHNPRPHYPLVSRRLKEQGLVVVRLCVNDQGIVGESFVSQSSGFQNLDQSALKALSQWRFVPIASNSSNFLSRCFQMPVQFTLEG